MYTSIFFKNLLSDADYQITTSSATVGSSYTLNNSKVICLNFKNYSNNIFKNLDIRMINPIIEFESSNIKKLKKDLLSQLCTWLY